MSPWQICQPWCNICHDRLWGPSVWLEVTQRINFKILLYTFKCLHGLAPPPGYLVDLLQPHKPPRLLRSTDAGLLQELSSKYRTAGGSAFSHAAPRLWNSLPVTIRNTQSIETFMSMLKTHLLVSSLNHTCTLSQSPFEHCWMHKFAGQLGATLPLAIWPAGEAYIATSKIIIWGL